MTRHPQIRPLKCTEADKVRRVRLRRFGLFGLSLAVVFLMYQPTVESLSSTLPWNLGDPALNTWVLAWESHALMSDLSRFFEGNIYHPDSNVLLYSEIILPALPPFAVTTGLTGSPIVAHNVVILLLALLSVVATYQLARRLIGAPYPAMLAAISVSFSGYVFIHQSHLQLLTLGFFPLAFLALFRTLDSGRMADGLWLGVTTALLATGSLYYAAIWMVCLVTIVLLDLRRRRGADRRWWFAIGTGAAVSIGLVGPIAYAYASFQDRVGFVRGIGATLNPIDFVTPPPGSLVYGTLFEWASPRPTPGLVEHGFFLGFVVTLLALVGGLVYVFVGRKTSAKGPPEQSVKEMGYMVTVGLVSLVLAVGPEVIGLPMPFQVLREFVPGFDSIRAVSRFAVPALLTASLLAPWLLDRLLMGRSPRARASIFVLAGVLVLAEMWVEPLRVEVEEREPVRAVLSGMPSGAVIELPMRQVADSEFAFIEGERLLGSIGDWRPRFNGYSGGFPSDYFENILVMSKFPDLTSIDRMADLDIRYVVLHVASEPSDAAYGFGEAARKIGELPLSVPATRFGDAWLIDLELYQQSDT